MLRQVSDILNKKNHILNCVVNIDDVMIDVR